MRQKRLFHSACMALILILIASGCSSRGKKIRDFNIIAITVDALRADHLSVYGYPYKTSPHIDEFANQSIVFEYAYCTIPKTSASLASFLTGLHPFVHKTKPNRDYLDEQYITLAEALKLKGFFNCAIVDNANLSQKFGFHQGFDVYKGIWNDIEQKVESTSYMTEAILEFLRNNKKRPFFMWAHYIEPHSPYLPPAQFVEERPRGRLIKDVNPKIIASQRRYMNENSSEGDFLARYDGAIKYTDSEFKKIFDVIVEEGYDKNSIIILSSDHGEELGEYNYFYNHGPLTFHSGTRIPLIMYIPWKKNRRINYPVSLMDVYPTLLEEAGLSLPYEIQGVNLFERPKERFLFIKGHLGTRSIVYKNYHLVKVLPALMERLNLQEEYLFDIHKDPLEKEDISSSHKELQNLMDSKYMEFYNTHGYLNGKKAQEKKPPLSKKELDNLRSLGYIR
jgi:arylsulfatase A-like enzyme